MKQAAKSFDLYTDNPRMVPRQLVPTVLKMEMTVGKFQAQRFVTSPHDKIPLIVHLFALHVLYLNQTPFYTGQFSSNLSRNSFVPMRWKMQETLLNNSLIK